jgi:hypothetical protein
VEIVGTFITAGKPEVRGDPDGWSPPVSKKKEMKEKRRNGRGFRGLLGGWLLGPGVGLVGCPSLFFLFKTFSFLFFGLLYNFFI